MKINSAIATLGVGLLLAGALSGCASAASATDAQLRTPSDYIDNPPAQSAEQRDLLAKGVNADTYRQAFANYSACMAAAGYDLFDVRDNGVLVEYSISDDAVQAGVHQLCYPTEFAQIDYEWQLANEAK